MGQLIGDPREMHFRVWFMSKKFKKILYLMFLPGIIQFRWDAVKLSLQLGVLLLKIFLLLNWGAIVLPQDLYIEKFI